MKTFLKVIIKGTAAVHDRKNKTFNERFDLTISYQGLDLNDLAGLSDAIRSALNKEHLEQTQAKKRRLADKRLAELKTHQLEIKKNKSGKIINL